MVGVRPNGYRCRCGCLRLGWRLEPGWGIRHGWRVGFPPVHRRGTKAESGLHCRRAVVLHDCGQWHVRVRDVFCRGRAHVIHVPFVIFPAELHATLHTARLERAAASALGCPGWDLLGALFFFQYLIYWHDHYLQQHGDDHQCCTLPSSLPPINRLIHLGIGFCLTGRLPLIVSCEFGARRTSFPAGVMYSRRSFGPVL